MTVWLTDVLWCWNVTRPASPGCAAGESRFQQRQLRSKVRTDLADVLAAPGTKKKTGD